MMVHRHVIKQVLLLLLENVTNATLWMDYHMDPHMGLIHVTARNNHKNDNTWLKNGQKDIKCPQTVVKWSKRSQRNRTNTKRRKTSTNLLKTTGQSHCGPGGGGLLSVCAQGPFVSLLFLFFFPLQQAQQVEQAHGLRAFLLNIHRNLWEWKWGCCVCSQFHRDWTTQNLRTSVCNNLHVSVPVYTLS